MLKLLLIFASTELRKGIALLDSLAPVTLVPLDRGRGDGVYVGVDLISGNSVYWDFDKSSSPHTLIVGPTGSGKTITLLTLLNRITTKYGSSALIFDVKDEYAQLMSIFGCTNIEVLNPSKDPLPICVCSSPLVEKQIMISNAIETLSKIFSLSPTSSKMLFKALMDMCTRCVDVDALTVYHFDVLDRELEEVIDVITRIFNVYPELPQKLNFVFQAKTPRHRSIYLINLKHLLIRDRAESATVILHVLKTLLTYLSPSLTSTLRIVVALDEFWHATPYIAEELVNMLARYGRSLGLALIIATQNIDDIHPYTDAIVSNCGGFIAMSSSSTSYWLRIRPYLNLSRKAIDYIASIADQGVCVARFSPSSTSVILYVDPFNEFEV